MDKKDFIKKVDAYYKEAFTLGNEAYGIIKDVVAAHNGKLSYNILYGETEDPDWIYLDDNLTVNEIYIDSEGEIGIMVQDEYQEVFKKDLSYLVPDDRINIALFLCRR